MNIFKRLFGIKESQAQALLVMNQVGRPVAAPKDYESYSKEAYAKNVIAFRCINVLSDAISQIPWLLFKKTSRKQREEIEDHEILDLIDNPNPFQGKEAFFKQWAAYFLLKGDSYMESVNATMNFNAPPMELWNLRPDRMQIIPSVLGIPAAYQYVVGSNKVTYEVDALGRSNVMHTKSFNPLNDFYGQSPLESAAYEIDQHNEGNVWNLGTLQNSARPSGALVYDSKTGLGGTELTKEQRELLKQELKDAYSGSSNARKPMLLEGGLDWKEMGMSPVDMDYINSKSTTQKDIALAFGVPGQIVGVKDSQTFANFEQAKLAMYVDTVMPLAKLLRGQLNMWLVPKYGEGMELDIDEDGIDALAPLRKEKWEQVRQSDWLTTNEKREATKYGRYEPDTEDAADKIFITSSMIPIEVAASDFDTEPLTDTEDLVGDDSGDNGKGLITYLEGKQFNISTESGKRRFWREQNRKRNLFEKRFAAQVAAAFINEKEELLNAMEGVNPSLAEFVIASTLEETSKVMGGVLKQNIEAVARSFGEDVLSIGKSYSPDFETKDAETRFEQNLSSFVEEETARQIKLIYGTTRKRVVKAVKEEVALALEEGTAGEVALQKAIEKTYTSFTPARSRTIARTEVHNASNYASREAAKQLRIPNMKKEWITAVDERTRGMKPKDTTNHVAMNGEKVGVNEKFEVPSTDGTDVMDGPGDPNAPADQIINCRCVTTYVVER